MTWKGGMGGMQAGRHPRCRHRSDQLTKTKILEIGENGGKGGGHGEMAGMAHGMWVVEGVAG